MNQEQIEQDYQKALKRIREAKDTRATSLDLSGLIWDRLPPELFELTWLEVLAVQQSSEWDDPGGSISILPEAFTQLQSLRHLNISKLGVQHLTSLTALTQLISLRCGGNQLTDLTLLAALSQLTLLDCSHNQLSDLRKLTTLTNLTSLHCGFNQLTNLNPVASLHRLTSLSCQANSIRNFSPLALLPNFISLNCSGNQLSDLWSLSSLSQLTFLSCGNNQLTDLSPLAALAQLASLDCSYNQLTDLTPISSLTMLTTLLFWGNRLTDLATLDTLSQLTSLNCGNNQLTDLAPLAALKQLTTLDCEDNQLTDLAPLAALKQLTTLHCGKNHLTDLAPLAALKQLTTLHCSNNRLTDLAPLTALKQLATLHCGNNRLTDLAVIKPAVLNGQIQTLRVFNNPVVGIPHELLGTENFDNVASTLREYWLDMAQGSAPNRDVKVLLVGNGCVGKSTLAHGLRMGAAPPVPIDQRTHAIEIDTLEMPLTSDGPTLRWHLWDFGGQELYHATHRLFLHHQAVFLLLWAEETDEAPDEVRHPVSYWLGFIQDLSSGSPVLLVKNQIDRLDQMPRPPDLPEGPSPFYQELKMSALRYQGVETVKEAILDYFREHRERWAFDLPSSWLRLREVLEQRRGERVLPRAHFAQLCLQHGVRHPETALKYLHESGFCFYREGAFHDQVILDQNWMIELVYRLFDPRQGIRETLAHQHGLFFGKETQRYWPDHDECDREVILQFLTGSRMAFAVDGDHPWETPFEERSFVLPALLPADPPLSVNIWGAPQPDEWWVDCTYPFLHRGLIEAIIVRTAQLSPKREWWRNGVIFFDEKTGCQVMAQYAPEADLPSTIRFRFRGKGRPQTLIKVQRLLNELYPHRQPDLWVSLDGKDFVALAVLEQARQNGKPQVISRAQDIVEGRPYHGFLQLPERDTDQEVFPDPSGSTRRVRIFISYAHKDEDPYLERMKVCLKNLQRRFPIEFWHDRHLFAGEPWETEILQQLEQADLVCLLISPDFIASDYCYSKEMERALLKYEQGRGLPIPILIRATSDWTHFPIGRHQALPTPADPLAEWPDPDKFWASVQQGLRQQIERLLKKKSFQ